MKHSEMAWIAQEHLVGGRTQTCIANELGVSCSTVNVSLKKFCEYWAAIDLHHIYGDERKMYFRIALRNYLKQADEKPQAPTTRDDRIADKAFSDARNEHAWLLRAEGLKLKQIGYRLGVSLERARIMLEIFKRRVRRATIKAHFHIVTTEEK